MELIERHSYCRKIIDEGTRHSLLHRSLAFSHLSVLSHRIPASLTQLPWFTSQLNTMLDESMKTGEEFAHGHADDRLADAIENMDYSSGNANEGILFLKNTIDRSGGLIRIGALAKICQLSFDAKEHAETRSTCLYFLGGMIDELTSVSPSPAQDRTATHFARVCIALDRKQAEHTLDAVSAHNPMIYDHLVRNMAGEIKRASSRNGDALKIHNEKIPMLADAVSRMTPSRIRDDALLDLASTIDNLTKKERVHVDLNQIQEFVAPILPSLTEDLGRVEGSENFRKTTLHLAKGLFEIALRAPQMIDAQSYRRLLETQSLGKDYARDDHRQFISANVAYPLTLTMVEAARQYSGKYKDKDPKTQMKPDVAKDILSQYNYLYQLIFPLGLHRSLTTVGEIVNVCAQAKSNNEIQFRQITPRSNENQGRSSDSAPAR